MSSTDSEVDPRLLVALGHPFRQEVMMVLCGKPANAEEVAAITGVGMPAVRRHMHVLLANDVIEAVGESTHPDATRYRSMVRPFLDDAHWRRLPAHRRRALFAMTLRRIAVQVEQGMARDEFDHDQTHVSFSRLQLDEQGWQELTDLLAGAVEEAMQIEAESAGRLAARGEGATVESKLAIVHFGRR